MNEYPIVAEKILKNMHVDDLVSGDLNLVDVENLKHFDYINGIRICHRFKMIIPVVEQIYAKQLFSSSSGHAKILGLGWNKTTNKINIEIPQFSKRQIMKRNMLS